MVVDLKRFCREEAATSTTEYAIIITLIAVAIMLGSLLMSIAIPEAFGDKAVLFALSYVFIQVGRHLFLTFIAADPHTVERSRSAHILSWFSISAVFWIAGALAGGDTQSFLWIIALTIDSAGPIFVYYVPWLNRLDPEAWAISPGHFVERFQLFTIIALGESIVLTGATTREPVTRRPLYRLYGWHNRHAEGCALAFGRHLRSRDGRRHVGKQ